MECRGFDFHDGIGEIESTPQQKIHFSAPPDAFERCGEEISDQLDVTPARYFIRRVVRPVFRRKRARHLPPVVAAVRTEVLAADYLQVDETTVRYLRPGTGKSWLGYLWQARRPGGGLFYHWGAGRGRGELIECIGDDFAGHLQCDAYTVYESYARERPEVRLIACLAHIRRGFTDSLKAGRCRHAALIVHLIGQLYRIETRLREKKAGPALRESVRAWQSAPLVRRIGKMLKVLLPKHRPSTPAGKALAYAVRHWEKFGRYLENGAFEIDNNLVENAIRPTKLGAKNWLCVSRKEVNDVKRAA